MIYVLYMSSCYIGDHRDCMIVGFTTTYTTSANQTKVVSSNPPHGEVNSIQHYVKKFVSDLPQVGGFLRALRFSPPIKLRATL